MRLCSLVIFVILFYSQSLYSQSVTSSAIKPAQQAYEEAGRYIRAKEYPEAISLLNSAIKRDPSFVAAFQQLGDLYRLSNDFIKAKNAYQRVISLNPDFNPLTFYGLAMSEFNTANYASAVRWFTEYLKTPNIPDKSVKLVNKLIKDSEFSIRAIERPVRFEPKNQGSLINTKNEEYFPSVTADNEAIIFTRRTNKNEDFYESRKVNNQWAEPSPLSPNINTLQFNEGTQSISPDGTYLFFTGCNRPDGLGRCDIYICKKEGNDWSTPFNPGEPLNSPAWESQPALSADGQVLYFVSDRKGGLGGNDIWKTTLRPDGHWSEPVNLGPNINTPYNEHSPYIHPDNKTLYFSSNGWPGLGNQDLFVSKFGTSDSWSIPENLGYPINTFEEQTGLRVSTDGNTAYYASDRKGGYGGMDIYSFELNGNVRPHKVTYIKGKITDIETNIPVLSARISIVDLNTQTSVFMDNNTEGEFLMTLPQESKYAFNVSKKGYMPLSEYLSMGGDQSDQEPFILNIRLKPIKLNEQTTLKNIFFETDKYALLPASKAELNILIDFLKENPTVSIEIEGHTDNVGSTSLNLTLSESRAKEVYKYLIENKINKGRLSYKGYGFTRPVADNKTENGRMNNRRTSFSIKAK